MSNIAYCVRRFDMKALRFFIMRLSTGSSMVMCRHGSIVDALNAARDVMPADHMILGARLATRNERRSIMDGHNVSYSGGAT